MRRIMISIVGLFAAFMLIGATEPSGPSKLAATAYAADSAPTPFAVYENSTLREIIKRGTLLVGMEVEYWPFEYADEKGQAVGFDVAIADLAARELGVKLEIKDMEWTGLIPALQSGKVDMVISGMTATLERAKSVTFTDPYFVTGLCLLGSAKRPKLASVKDLDAAGRIVAVKTGTTADLWAGKNLTQATINRYKDETACVREVVTGRADAFLYDQLSIAKHQGQNADSTYAVLEPFTYEPFGIALRKGDFDFWQWLNQYLATIKRDGRYQELFDSHLGPALAGKAK
jgi:polar amino acid transport system substrate-binding protein